MAGSYPDAPDLRMAYERDGTVGFLLQLTAGSVVAPVPGASMLAMNDEGSGSAAWVTIVGSSPPNGSQRCCTCLIFPELRDLVAYKNVGVYASVPSGWLLETSVNTTNGLDGTWVSQAWPNKDTVHNVLDLRNVTALAVAGIKAIRWSVITGASGGQTHNTITMHLYGKPSAGQNPNRLRLWHPTLDQEVTGAYFDWGNIARSSSADRTFRLRNNSASLTANTITVSTDAPSETTPLVAGQHLLERASNPGFTATVVVATLAPGATSEIITLRRTTPVNATTSLWWARVLASAASWV